MENPPGALFVRSVSVRPSAWLDGHVSGTRDAIAMFISSPSQERTSTKRATRQGGTQAHEIRPPSPRASEHVDGHGIAGTPLELGGAEVLGAEGELAGPEERDRKRGFRHAVDHLYRRAAEDSAIDYQVHRAARRHGAGRGVDDGREGYRRRAERLAGRW